MSKERYFNNMNNGPISVFPVPLDYILCIGEGVPVIHTELLIFLFGYYHNPGSSPSRHA